MVRHLLTEISKGVYDDVIFNFELSPDFIHGSDYESTPDGFREFTHEVMKKIDGNYGFIKKLFVGSLIELDVVENILKIKFEDYKDSFANFEFSHGLGQLAIESEKIEIQTLEEKDIEKFHSNVTGLYAGSGLREFTPFGIYELVKNQIIRIIENYYIEIVKKFRRQKMFPFGREIERGQTYRIKPDVKFLYEEENKKIYIQILFYVDDFIGQENIKKVISLLNFLDKKFNLFSQEAKNIFNTFYHKK